MFEFKKAVQCLSAVACAATVLACGSDGQSATGNAPVVNVEPVAAQSIPNNRTEVRRIPSDVIPLAVPRARLTRIEDPAFSWDQDVTGHYGSSCIEGRHGPPTCSAGYNGGFRQIDTGTYTNYTYTITN